MTRHTTPPKQVLPKPMPPINLVVDLSEQKTDQLSKLARNLNCTTDELVKSIIDRHLKNQDIIDRYMSPREIHHVVAHSPIFQYLVKREPPTVGNEPDRSPNTSFDIDNQLMAKWEKLLITQDIGLPMWWNAQLVNHSEDKSISSSEDESHPENFSHPELAQALDTLSTRLQAELPASTKG